FLGPARPLPRPLRGRAEAPPAVLQRVREHASVARMFVLTASNRSAAADALASALVALGAVLAAAFVARALLRLSAAYPLAAAVLFGAAAAGVVALAARALPGSFGAANRVTLVRAALTAL